MKKNTMKFGLMAGVLAAASIAGTGAAHASPLAPAPAATKAVTAKVGLPVIAGAQSLSKTEKAATAGEGLVSLNVLNNSNLNLLNNLNILNIGSFNSFKWGGSGGSCGCTSPS